MSEQLNQIAKKYNPFKRDSTIIASTNQEIINMAKKIKTSFLRYDNL
ncbi:hypothetical protein J2T14_004369 [Paenibacillus harenae]|nr:hypothetical protein [Paenibacillus harenae]